MAAARRWEDDVSLALAARRVIFRVVRPRVSQADLVERRAGETAVAVSMSPVAPACV